MFKKYKMYQFLNDSRVFLSLKTQKRKKKTATERSVQNENRLNKRI